MGGKSRPHRDSIPDRPARGQSLYRLSYPALSLLWDLGVTSVTVTGELSSSRCGRGGRQQVPIHTYQSQQKLIWFLFHIIKDYKTFTQMKTNKWIITNLVSQSFELILGLLKVLSGCFGLVLRLGMKGDTSSLPLSALVTCTGNLMFKSVRPVV